MKHQQTHLLSWDAALPAASATAGRWLAEGRQMARREGHGVFDSIELTHTAEAAAGQIQVQHWKARGQTVLARRNALEQTLEAAGFNPADHLRDIAHGTVDLAWALGLLLLNSLLAVFVLLGFGPWYLTVPLALLVLVTALPVEEFFQAYDERASLREGIFLTLTLLALGAQFWLGTMRGLFLAALTPAAVGPVTQALYAAAPILRYGLGVLAIVSEGICGYKLYRARRLLCSPTARAVRERDRSQEHLVRIVATLKASEAEADIRRAYRQVGARQFLAAEAERDRQADRTHLRRAALGAVIALVILGLLFFLTPAAFAATSDQSARNVVVLLDLTKSVTLESFEANVRAVDTLLSRAAAQQRVVVLGITDGFGRPAMLLDRTLPASGYLGLELQAAREVLVAEWQALGQKLQPAYSRTDILGTLALLGYLGDLSFGDTTLIVFSDLRQSSALLDIERTDRINVEQVLARLKKGGALPKLAGMQVFLLGVEPAGKSAAYFASLKAFWERLLAEAGAQVRLFSMDRRIPEF